MGNELSQICRYDSRKNRKKSEKRVRLKICDDSDIDFFETSKSKRIKRDH